MCSATTILCDPSEAFSSEIYNSIIRHTYPDLTPTLTATSIKKANRHALFPIVDGNSWGDGAHALEGGNGAGSYVEMECLPPESTGNGRTHTFTEPKGNNYVHQEFPVYLKLLYP